MYKNFLMSELKKWTRDPMMKFMLLYPLIFAIIGRFVIPEIMSPENLSRSSDFIVVILTLMTPIIFGAIIAFSILDDRDDNILTSIRTTPLSIHKFLSFRLIVSVIMSFITCVFVMWFSDIGDLPFGAILSISILTALAAPMTGLLINALASNKIEGFAVMKGTAMIIIIPFVSLFFVDYKEFFFSFIPGFWPAKAISSLIRGENVLLLSYYQYYFIGLIYILILNILVYYLFLKRTKV